MIGRAFGGVVICDSRLAGPASYDERGRRYVFVPTPGDEASYAMDVELTSTEMPTSIAERLGADSLAVAFRRWTEHEVMAKLLDLPILSVLRSVPSSADSLVIERADSLYYWIAIGRLS